MIPPVVQAQIAVQVVAVEKVHQVYIRLPAVVKVVSRVQVAASKAPAVVFEA